MLAGIGGGGSRRVGRWYAAPGGAGLLDRLISGAGAVTDAADRAVRLLASGSRREFATTRPGSIAVAVVLVVLASLFVLAGLEATDPPTPVAIDPADAATTRGFGNRTYSTLDGSVHSVYVETFLDDNGNGVEDAGESGFAWYYWLVDREARAGVTVRSTRPPSEVYTFTGAGRVVDDPGYLTEDRRSIDNEVRATGLQLDSTRLIDATVEVDRPGAAVDLAAGLPATGTVVSISGSRLGSWVSVCTEDRNSNGHCDESEFDRYEVVVFDPVSRRAVRVHAYDLPEFTDATLTGTLRHEERAVDHALQTDRLQFDRLDLAVSERYIFEEGVGPGSAPLAFVLAGLLVGVAGVIVVGLAGGYLVYRRGSGGLPTAATTLAPGERLPLRITGLVRTPTGLEHVREAPGELVRFMQATPPTAAPEPAAPATDDWAPDAGATDAGAPDVIPIATTLIIERTGYPQGVEVGLGHVERLSSGEVMTLRAPRPATRVVAGTGPLFLSFDSDAERDRAVAELLDETGLGPDGRRIQTP